MDFLAVAVSVGLGYFLGRWGRRPALPPSKKRISSKTRLLVWERDFPGKKRGLCACCSRPVLRDEAWHCSHVVAEARGGSNSPHNLAVCCPTCNLKMGTRNLLEYKAKLGK